MVLKSILRRSHVDWRLWAATRLATGQRLSPTDAVGLGLFRNAVCATSRLATWWAEQRYTAGRAVDVEAIAESGLVDHLGQTPGQRANPAGDLLVWIQRAAGTRQLAAA